MTRTRIVQWLRVLLPILALVILSTMFLFSGRSGTAPEIPYAEDDAERMAREPRMVALQYSGVTRDGAELLLRALEAGPTPEGGGSARGLRLNYRRADGFTAELTAPDGALSDSVINLRGGVTMATSSGWYIVAEQIASPTDRSGITAAEGISGTAPFGEITAGAMELLAGTDQDDPAVINFADGVDLIYRP